MWPFLGWLVLAALSIWVCFEDITKRKISNNICLSVLFMSGMLSVVSGVFPDLLPTMLILFFGFVLTRLNIIAAGDIKLMAAFSIAIKPEFLTFTFLVIIFIGGLIGVLYLVMKLLYGDRYIKNEGVPFGVPISVGSLLGIAASL
mgnify:CR=1 FL=1